MMLSVSASAELGIHNVGGRASITVARLRRNG